MGSIAGSSVRRRPRLRDHRAPAYLHGRLKMELVHLKHRHAVSLMHADESASSEGRIAHRGLAAGYAARIAVLQQQALTAAETARAA